MRATKTTIAPNSSSAITTAAVRGLVCDAREKIVSIVADRTVDLRVEIPEVLGVDLVLQLGHAVHQIGVFGDLHGDVVELVEESLLGERLALYLSRDCLGLPFLRRLNRILSAAAVRDPEEVMRSCRQASRQSCTI